LKKEKLLTAEHVNLAPVKSFIHTIFEVNNSVKYQHGHQLFS